MDKKSFDQDRRQGLRPGVSVCIFDRQNRVLLGWKKEYNIWEIPQGGLEEQDATLPHAVAREIKEELGPKFAAALAIPQKCLLDIDKIVFPQSGLHGEKLKVGTKQYPMVGKKYYICAAALTKKIQPEKIEYQDFQWVDFAQGIKIASRTKQKGKKRILEKIFRLLKENAFIR
ncbi:MAG: hypothetical protein COU85_00850 [Candidatus Portnoybacteria bacterium CG10_big_fil_rev_8_21_14_0_10_44_7]|uniref:Nudix hydrolase domain-containing protein n=1 Tax=Candidatus Portnoybacteria bacterium CG10_big_fil_rev_8_21_14_0_10_44_7 TaxID=1974816 RepID=A0A2M8KJ64_9BACT|nr:MAG: hypothetical protein COU85_00850 [Candidatus Portnoybacteria bacterium CG10_big_fil_rev_8_21_14_0_10_44_7]